jgi:hypothetical protein
MPRFVAASALLLALGASVAAHGQGLPTEPVSMGDGRVVLGAEVIATFASSDPGFFNYTDYEYSALRNFRIGVAAEVRASRRLQFLGELRMDHGDIVQPFAFYARIRPWPDRPFDIQVGRIPPTFGLFGRGTYGTSNMLIGTPLAYQYLTSLRPDALPAVPEDLIRMRGRGWLSNFPLGNTEADRGLPVINSFRWDTGVQVHGINGLVEWRGAITTGSLSNPRVDDDNGGRQLSARGVLRPAPQLALGASAARGAYLDANLSGVLDEGRHVEEGVQSALGIDAEYSEGRFLGRTELIWTRWTVPMPGTSTNLRLDATSLVAEARYRVWPGLYFAGRAERLGFNRLQTSLGLQAWEAPVRRFEIGGGYSLIRNVIVKASWQRNLRVGGRVRDDSLGAIQLLYWF